MKKEKIETSQVSGKIALIVTPKVGQKGWDKSNDICNYCVSHSNWAQKCKKWKVDVRDMKEKEAKLILL
jgi:hypothetical protein